MSTHATLARLCAATLLSVFLCGADAALAQGGPPAFPQKFEVRGPENTSFAFAVTQPGPIVVDVQWQGAPLRAVLVGPNAVQQQGSGRLVINYNVTPQDLQKGTLWSINLGLLTPSPNGATGQINVQTPPVDGAAATRANQMMQRTLTKQQTDQVNAAFNASIDQYVNLRMSEFRRDLANRDQGERQKLQTVLAQQRSMQPAAPQAQQPAQGGEIRSRALPPPGGGTKIEAMKVPPGQRPVLIPIPPLQITALSQTTGGPISTVVVTGTSFGPNPGRVMLTVPAGIMVSPCTNCAPVATNSLSDTALNATIAQWTDTQITLSLPDLTGVQRYSGQVFVVRADNAYSNRIGFDFVPRQELRVFRGVPGDRRYTSTVVTRPLPPTSGTSMMHVRFPAFPFSEFVGEKGNDEYFPYTDLSNGWAVSRVRVVPLSELNGIPPEIATIIRDGGGAYIEGTPSGSDLYLNVRWWINALFPYAFYAWTLEITGPAGTPDGVIVR